MRLIDADALLDKQEALYMKRHILFHGVTAYTIESAPTIDPKTLPIVQQLRKELKSYKDLKVTPQQIALLMKFYKEKTSAESICFDMKLVAKVLELDNVKKQLEKVTAERNAAIADLRGCALESYAECMYCKNKDKRTMCAECKDGSNWKWSGFQEVKDE